MSQSYQYISNPRRTSEKRDEVCDLWGKMEHNCCLTSENLARKHVIAILKAKGALNNIN